MNDVDVVEFPYSKYERLREFFNELDNFIVDLENERDRFNKQSNKDEISRVLSYHYSKIVNKLKNLKRLV